MILCRAFEEKPPRTDTQLAVRFTLAEGLSEGLVGEKWSSTFIFFRFLTQGSKRIFKKKDSSCFCSHLFLKHLLISSFESLFRLVVNGPTSRPGLLQSPAGLRTLALPPSGSGGRLRAGWHGDGSGSGRSRRWRSRWWSARSWSRWKWKWWRRLLVRILGQQVEQVAEGEAGRPTAAATAAEPGQQPECGCGGGGSSSGQQSGRGTGQHARLWSGRAGHQPTAVGEHRQRIDLHQQRRSWRLQGGIRHSRNPGPISNVVFHFRTRPARMGSHPQ